jgi:protein-S-isoprenylcysteine O-methyltransferase Ste14
MMFTPAGMSDPSERPRQSAILLGTVVSLTGMILFVLSAGTMVFLWVRLLFQTMGWPGLIVGVCTAPLGVAYPLLHWLARGDFSPLIFMVWAVGIVGLMASTTWAAWGRHRAWHAPPPVQRQPEREGSALFVVHEDD